MNAIQLPNANQIYIIIGGQTAADRLLDLAAQLALRGPVLLLDCGNRANPRKLVRELRRYTLDPVRALDNIRTARAFTCHQVNALLEQTALTYPQQPVLITDLLATYYDESIPFTEARRLLETCLSFISAIHSAAPVVISSKRPPADFPERSKFVEMLLHLPNQRWIEEVVRAPSPKQQQFSLLP